MVGVFYSPWLRNKVLVILFLNYPECCILYHCTNNEDHVGITKYYIYFYSSTATFVWSRNTVRERSYISFFSIGDALGGLERRPESWQVCLSIQRVSAFSPKLKTLHCLCKSHAEIGTSSSPHVLTVYSWLLELTYFRFFFGYLLILYANGNICHRQ